MLRRHFLFSFSVLVTVLLGSKFIRAVFLIKKSFHFDYKWLTLVSFLFVSEHTKASEFFCQITNILDKRIRKTDRMYSLVKMIYLDLNSNPTNPISLSFPLVWFMASVIAFFKSRTRSQKYTQSDRSSIPMLIRMLRMCSPIFNIGVVWKSVPSDWYETYNFSIQKFHPKERSYWNL